MASKLDGYDCIVECPYNKAHQILQSRIQTHLVKCRKSYPNVEKTICPFNSTHAINKQELNYHVKNCPDRSNLERYRFSIGQAEQQPAAFSPPKTTAPPITSSECWDDLNVPSYNPQEYVQNSPVLRTLKLAPPAQRTAFREAERKRLNNMN